MHVKEFPTELQNSGISSVTLPKSDLTTDVLPTRKTTVQTCSVTKVFLEISQNSQENNCARDSLPATLLKKRVSDTRAFL